MTVDPPQGRPPRAGGVGSDARTVMAGCAACCALVALACLASGVALAARPPSPAALFQPIVFHAGNLGLSMAVSGTPDCPPEIVDCAVPPQPDRLYGSVWFWVTSRNQTGISTSFKPLLRLRLR